MRTSELAGRAGVHPETLRYYERRGLLVEPPRTAGGYRDYPAAAVELCGDTYPFSTSPTRHRVRLDDGVEVHAMCAIDALGIAAMLGRDTRFGSIDVTNGRPVTVTSTAGRTVWDPAGAVVFIGADPGGGASADCCCDYLNFFTDHHTAATWAARHPHVPGHILTQGEAVDLGTRLFGPLLGRGPESP